MSTIEAEPLTPAQQMIADQLDRSRRAFDEAQARSQAMDRAYAAGTSDQWFKNYADNEVAKFIGATPSTPDAPLPDDSLPAGTDTTGGITPAGLNWFRLGNLQTPHDADTFKGDFILPWGVTIANPHGIRALGFDACEVDRTRRSVVVTDAEIEQGKKAREALIKLLSVDHYMEAAPEGNGTRDSYGRPLAWIRLWHKDGVINLAEWAIENKYDRNVWLKSQGPTA